MPRLKVFRSHQGFYDTIVATTSRPKALAAWGARPSLFRQGFAEETKDAGAVAAALAQPGVVLSRPFGSNGVFQAHPELPKAPKMSARQKAAHTRARKQREREATRRERAKRAAERRRQKQAKAELEEIAREEAKLRERRQALRKTLHARAVKA